MSASMIVIYITRETGLLRESGCNLKTVMRDCFSFVMVVGYEKAEKFPDWPDSFGRSEIAGPAKSWTHLIARPAVVTSCPDAPELSPPPAQSHSPVCSLLVFQGCIPLQGCQVNELTANPDEPGRHLFEIVPGEGPAS